MRGWGWLPSVPLPAMTHALQTGQAHQARNPFASHPDPKAESELRLNTGSTIGATRLEVNLSDRGRQRLIRYCPRRRDTVTPGVVAGPRYLKHPARHRDGEAIGGELVDEPEPYFGSTFSRAK